MAGDTHRRIGGAADRDDSPGTSDGGTDRRETELERHDRNYVELLQELRVVQTGTQILFAFLLTMSVSPGFGRITDFQRFLYVGTLLAATAASGLLIAPVSFHRILFRQRRKKELVDGANRMALGGLALLALALLGSVLLVLDIALDGWTPFFLAGLAALWFLVFWYAVPLRYRRGTSDDDA